MFANKRKTILFSNNNKPKNNLSTYAINYKNKVIANGGSISTSILTIFDNQFFKPAELNGNILNEADRINIWKGQGNEIAALTSLVGSVLATNVGGLTWDNSIGYKSNTTTKYLNLNFNVSTGVKFLQNNNSFGQICNNYPIGIIGCQRGGSFYCQSYGIGTTALAGTNMLGTAVSNNLTLQTFSGYYVYGTKRNNNVNYINFKDNNSSTRTASSTTPDGINMFETSQNFNGNPNSNDGNAIHCASWNGSSSFDYITFKTLCINLWAALGV